MICKGYHDLNIKENDLKSLFNYLKIPPTDKLHYYLFNKHFKGIIDRFIADAPLPIQFYEDKTLFPASASSKHSKKSSESGRKELHLKKSDEIRLRTAEDLYHGDGVISYEMLLLNVVSEWFVIQNRLKENKAVIQRRQHVMKHRAFMPYINYHGSR